jgi:chemotaxis signal transduction protein
MTDNFTNLLAPIAPIGSISIELIVFEIAEVSFGIPMTKINRVISNIFLGEDYSLTQDVKIVDLHQRLTGIEIANFNAIAIYTSAEGQLYGIPIETVPSLMTIPLDRIRTIPQQIRTNNPLGIASHIAMIVNSELELTIFILA